MNELGLFSTLAVLFIIVYAFNRVSSRMLTKIEEKDKQVKPSVKAENYTSTSTSEKDYKIVMEKKNDSSTRKKVADDLNDKQNLDPKYSPNVVRAKNGRFKSKKEWKKEQETS